eukprot:409-Heterococcus_DN1.PRE.1
MQRAAKLARRSTSQLPVRNVPAPVHAAAAPQAVMRSSSMQNLGGHNRSSSESPAPLWTSL